MPAGDRGSSRKLLQPSGNWSLYHGEPFTQSRRNVHYVAENRSLGQRRRLLSRSTVGSRCAIKVRDESRAPDFLLADEGAIEKV